MHRGAASVLWLAFRMEREERGNQQSQTVHSSVSFTPTALVTMTSFDKSKTKMLSSSSSQLSLYKNTTEKRRETWRVSGSVRIFFIASNIYAKKKKHILKLLKESAAHR